ncbi:MAG: helix-turn-helix transcriptional regulator [Bacteroidetes bacterium]|nr:helix-turn-helix transcriptional regulator [Bacteroidota bacterium]
MNIVSIIVLLGALQGFLLSFSISSMKRGNKQANRIVALYILFIAITLLGRYAYTVTSESLFFAKLLFVGDFVIFFYGPLLYLYFLRLFQIRPTVQVALWVHFIPLMVFSAVILPFLGLDTPQFIVYSGRLEYIFYFLEGVAIVQNFFYVWVNAGLIRNYRKESVRVSSAVPQMQFYIVLLGITAIGLFFWTISFLLRFIDPEGFHGFLGYQMVWISLSALIIALGYYTMRNPEALTGLEGAEDASETPQPLKNADALLRQLDEIMKSHRPFLEPKLTLPDLAKISGLQVHILSRVINEATGKNFFEFVNSYRVEEFKRIATPERLRTMTLFALSLEAGFNSKSTFNAAFKKLTNRTPREYFRTLPQ